MRNDPDHGQKRTQTPKALSRCLRAATTINRESKEASSSVRHTTHFLARKVIRRFIIIVKMAVHIFNTYNRMFDSILALYSKIRFVFESVSKITTAPYVNATETHSERRWRLFKRRWRPVGLARRFSPCLQSKMAGHDDVSASRLLTATRHTRTHTSRHAFYTQVSTETFRKTCALHAPRSWDIRKAAGLYSSGAGVTQTSFAHARLSREHYSAALETIQRLQTAILYIRNLCTYI